MSTYNNIGIWGQIQKAVNGETVSIPSDPIWDEFIQKHSNDHVECHRTSCPDLIRFLAIEPQLEFYTIPDWTKAKEFLKR